MNSVKSAKRWWLVGLFPLLALIAMTILVTHEDRQEWAGTLGAIRRVRAVRPICEHARNHVSVQRAAGWN